MFVPTDNTVIMLERPLTVKVVLGPGAVVLNLCKTLLELVTPQLAKSWLL